MGMKVITYGTFDLFHYGHYNLLKRARDLGDHLYVGVSSDAFCLEKGKVPFLNQEKRMEIVSSLRFVEEVFLEHSLEQKVDDVRKYGINLFILGDDYKDIFPQMKEYKALLEMGCKVVFLERTPNVSSTQLREIELKQAKLDANPNSLHNLTNI